MDLHKSNINKNDVGFKQTMKKKLNPKTESDAEEAKIQTRDQVLGRRAVDREKVNADTKDTAVFQLKGSTQKEIVTEANKG
jgi:hypothetical protein